MGVSPDPRQAELHAHLSARLAPGGPGSDAAREDLEAMRLLAASDKPALARTCYEPGHFTASGFVLSPDRQCLLLVFHEKLRLWLQPGGHVEPDDADLVAAARREVEEETGLVELRVERTYFDFDVHRTPPIGETPAHLHHDVRCLFSAMALDVRAGDGVSDAVWFPLRALCAPAHDLAGGFGTDESVRRVARRVTEMHCK